MPDINLTTLGDGYFHDCQKCNTWLSDVVMHCKNFAGLSPNIRLGAYLNGQTTYMTVDIFSTKGPESDISITIGLSANSISLHSPVASSQIDLSVPGLVDAFYFIDVLSNSLGATMSTRYPGAVSPMEDGGA